LEKEGNDGIEPSTFWLTANCSTAELITQGKEFSLTIEHMGTRTQNPRLKRPSLYRLSYMLEIVKNHKKFTGKEGIEPPKWSLKLHILPLNYFPWVFFWKNISDEEKKILSIGIQPTFSTWKADVLALDEESFLSTFQGGRIWTSDLLLPKQVL
jgi:hypothetical protein